MAFSNGSGVESKIKLSVDTKEVEQALSSLAKLKTTISQFGQGEAQNQKMLQQAMVYYQRSEEIANRSAQNNATAENNRVLKKQESEAKIQRLAEESATKQVALEEQSNAKILALYQKVASEKERLDNKNSAQIEKINAQTELYKKRLEQTALRMKKYANETENATKKTKIFNKAFEISKLLSLFYTMKKLGNAITSLFQGAADYYENINLFNIVMGDSINKGERFVNTLSNVFGLDESALYRYSASFKGMANNMGIVEDKAYTMAESLTKMTYDLSALYNTQMDESFEALMSAVTGQVKSIRDKFAGIDITEKSLQVQLSYMGINDRTVGQLNYAEKSILRYLSIQRQAANAQGVFASEMMKPAQMLKLLGDRIVKLGRAIGNIFIPILSKLLPYLMAVVGVLTILAQMLANTIALLLGFDFSEFEESGINKVGSGIQENFDNATESVKKFKRQLQGFDVLNVITTSEQSGNGNNNTNNNIDKRLLEAIKEWDMHLELASKKINEIRDNMLEWLGISKQVDGKTKKITYSLEKGVTPIKTIMGVLGAVAGGSLLKGLFDFAAKIPSIINGIQVIMGMLSGNAAASSASVFMGGKLASIGTTLTGLQIVFSALTNPITLIVVAIAAVVAILIHAYKTSEEFRNSVNTMAENFMSMLSAIYEALQPAITFIWGILKPALEWVWETIKIVLQNIYDAIVFVFDLIFTFLGGWFKIIEKLIKGDFAGAWETYVNLINTVKDKISGFLGKMWERFKGWLGDTWDAILEIGSNLLKWLSEIPSKILYRIGYAIGKIWKLITETDWKGLGKNVLNAIINGLANFGKKIATWVGNLFDKTKEAFTNIDWGQLGQNILDGIINGAKKFGNKIKEWGNSLLKGMKDALGIKSPSRRARKEIGLNVGLGNIQGMEDSVKEVDNYADKLIGRIRKKLIVDTKTTISYENVSLPKLNDLYGTLNNNLDLNQEINANALNQKIDHLTSAMSLMEHALIQDKNSNYTFPIYIGSDKVDEVTRKRQVRINNMYGISR